MLLVLCSWLGEGGVFSFLPLDPSGVMLEGRTSATLSSEYNYARARSPIHFCYYCYVTGLAIVNSYRCWSSGRAIFHFPEPMLAVVYTLAICLLGRPGARASTFECIAEPSGRFLSL